MENDKGLDKMESICVRMPHSLKAKLDAKCKSENIRVAEKMRDLAAKYVDDPTLNLGPSLAVTLEEVKKRDRECQANLSKLEAKLLPTNDKRQLQYMTRKAAVLCGINKGLYPRVADIVDALIADDKLMQKLYSYQPNWREDTIENRPWKTFLDYIEESIRSRAIDKELAEVRLKLHGIEEITMGPSHEIEDSGEEPEPGNSPPPTYSPEPSEEENSGSEESDSGNVDSDSEGSDESEEE